MDDPRPLIDNEEEVRFIYELQYGSLSLSEEAQNWYKTMDWLELTRRPRYIGLPCVVYYEPKKKNSFPDKKLWGVLMTIEFKKRPQADGILFVCANQTKAPPLKM